MATAAERTNPTTTSLAKIDTWMQRLADETDQVAHSTELTRYLQTVGRFYTYSAHNCALIAIQRPTATRVAGYRAWRSMGRQVKKGATGIAILCPAPIKGKTEEGDEAMIALRFRVGYVFDTLSRDSMGCNRLRVDRPPTSRHGEEERHAGRGGVSEEASS